ncbi:hypothetical protein CTA1_9014 [Colletotrichum tanaceti]|uniref:Uncharacterized protein n=1 Tax=Colletotrichum tanaceti TaxID=1306861 RepID=A0A4U6X880_9PEZI|nr:hypothetical protein CTA1_9014 [Colletotrichum tanaceti]
MVGSEEPFPYTRSKQTWTLTRPTRQIGINWPLRARPTAEFDVLMGTNSGPRRQPAEGRV